jgi:hypothetical protein
MQAKFLASMTHERCGLESLAILYALPYALLIWSYVSADNCPSAPYTHYTTCRSTIAFVVAFMYTCFFSSSSTTRFLVGAVVVAVGLLIALCIRTGWTNEVDESRLLPQWHDNPEESRGTTPPSNAMRDVEPQERKASNTLTYCDTSAEDKNQDAIRQRSWGFIKFFWNATSASHIQVDHNERQKAEV